MTRASSRSMNTPSRPMNHGPGSLECPALVLGATYAAAGPHERVVRIKAITDTGYVTEGKGQSAAVIRFGCERFWTRIDRTDT